MLVKEALSPRVPRITPREEKTEQLVDTRHEVDQLVLELQKVKQEVSAKACACVWRGWWRLGCPGNWSGGSGMQHGELPGKSSVSFLLKATLPESQSS